MLAYVKLDSAYNLVYNPALLLALRLAIISAKQQKINLKMEKSVKSIINICFEKNEAGSLCKIRLGILSSGLFGTSPGHGIGS